MDKTAFVDQYTMNDFVVFDIETHFDKTRAIQLEGLPKKPTIQDAINILSKQYKRQTTIDGKIDDKLKSMETAYNKSLKSLHVKPQLVNIKLITLKGQTKQKPFFKIFENPDNDPIIEKAIIEEVFDILLRSMSIITYNGAMFDMPVMMYRGLALKCQINYKQLLEWSNRFSKTHIDLSRYFTNKLDYNLKVIYGKGKITIDFDKTSFDDLKRYAIDEMNSLYNLTCTLLGYNTNEDY